MQLWCRILCSIATVAEAQGYCSIDSYLTEQKHFALPAVSPFITEPFASALVPSDQPINQQNKQQKNNLHIARVCCCLSPNLFLTSLSRAFSLS